MTKVLQKMRRKLFLTNPIFVLVVSLCALLGAIGLYIRWFFIVKERFGQLLARFELKKFEVEAPVSWPIIILLTLFLGLIIYGLILIFTYYQKLKGLYQSQENFINNFTHELKTPIASLRLGLETLERHELSPSEKANFLNNMMKDTERLAERVDSILETSRIEEGPKGFTRQIVNAHEYVLQVITQIRDIHRDCEIIFESHDSEKNPLFIEVGVELFPILLENLVSNGLKYNLSEFPQITIRIKQENQRLVLDCLDNGIGIPDSEKKKIFKKFYRYHPPELNRIKRPPGSGLGLYVIAQLANFHRAKIEVLSQQTGGSIFRLRFPLKKRPIE